MPLYKCRIVQKVLFNYLSVANNKFELVAVDNKIITIIYR